MESERTIIGLGERATVTCPLAYEKVRWEIFAAESRHSHVVELPIDWTVGSNGSDARDSLLGLAAIRSVRSWPS